MGLPQLKKALFSGKKDSQVIEIQKLLDLPEKVVQFGTGVLLRGFVEYFIDEANKKGRFNGRIVAVQSTAAGRSDAFTAQDGLFTLVTEGFEKGKAVQSFSVNSSISRTLSAAGRWDEVLLLAHNPDLVLAVSNTTEVGLTYREESIFETPPATFPGKLTSFLYERWRYFDGDVTKGLVIIPCELVPDNGDLLADMVFKHAHTNRLEQEFIEWLKLANTFCNSLVDRIVPGVPGPEKKQKIEEQLGYTDELLTVAEVYRLWAIEGSESLKELLSFADCDPGVIITPDITPYRERKLRILNGGHTISIAAGLLLGHQTVEDCMNDQLFADFITGVMHKEIVPSLDVDPQSATEFADEVLDRFRNPFLKHKLYDIAVQYTSKMHMRNALTIVKYYNKTGKLPRRMCLGFAAYLVYSIPHTKTDAGYMGSMNGATYLLRDDKADVLFSYWGNADLHRAETVKQIVSKILADANLWGKELPALPGFAEEVGELVVGILGKGVKNFMN